MLRAFQIRIPRTASTSIRAALKELPPEKKNHFSAARYLSAFPDEFPISFSFSFIRNPYHQIRSFYELERLQNKLPGEMRDFKYWLTHPERRRTFGGVDPLNQTKWICDNAGNCMCTRIYRFEHLVESFAQLCRDLNLSPRPLRKLEALTGGPRPVQISDVLKDAVHSQYAHLFSMLGFDPDTGKPVQDKLKGIPLWVP